MLVTKIITNINKAAKPMSFLLGYRELLCNDGDSCENIPCGWPNASP